MIVNKETKEILRNFAGINPNLAVEKGKPIHTINEEKTVYAVSSITGEHDFGIYDLAEFLSVLGMFSDSVDLDFDKNEVRISEGKNSVRYRFASPDILTKPTKAFKAPPGVVDFTLTNDEISRILKASSALNLPQVTVERESDNSVRLVLCDPKNSSENTFSIVVDDVTFTGDEEFSFALKVANLKMIAGDYKVAMNEKCAVFTNEAREITYVVALEL